MGKSVMHIWLCYLESLNWYLFHKQKKLNQIDHSNDTMVQCTVFALRDEARGSNNFVPEVALRAFVEFKVSLNW